MLKIKDNVDLKELEKFGYNDNQKWHDEFTLIKIDDDKEIHLILYSKPKLRIPMEMYEENIIRCYIQDLIKADLVERVDD